MQDAVRAAIIGMPRSGTTWMAHSLNLQPGVRWIRDYLPSFTHFLRRERIGWRTTLSLPRRRSALALVRADLLSARFPTLVAPEDFSSIDDLHTLVCRELAEEGDFVVGHKWWLRPQEIRQLLDETPVKAILMIRDPRDAAFSYWHRAHGGVEAYLEDWCETVELAAELAHHPRLITLRFEDAVATPAETMAQMLRRLHGEAPPLPQTVSPLVADAQNSVFEPDAGVPGGTQPWRHRLAEPIVQYAGWRCRKQLVAQGYPTGPHLNLRASANTLRTYAAASTRHALARLADRLSTNLSELSLRPRDQAY